MITLTLLALTQIASAKAPPEPGLNTLLAQYEKYGHHVSGLKRECVTFAVVKSTKKETTIVEREVHNKACGGDPSTSPTVATFVVRGKQVLIQDPTTEKLVPFDANFRSDGP
jgi:hypothetical protein